MLYSVRMEFQGWPKIRRWSNTFATITEKVDGTNAALVFDEDGALSCQSRKRFITPGDDNFGFASWANSNAAELFGFFGPGRHFGEWFGRGIQRSYGLADRRFTPFNVSRFNRDLWSDWPDGVVPLPVLDIVPVDRAPLAVELFAEELRQGGSRIVPGFLPAEGLMIYIDSLGHLKVPFNNGQPKSTS